MAAAVALTTNQNAAIGTMTRHDNTVTRVNSWVSGIKENHLVVDPSVGHRQIADKK